MTTLTILPTFRQPEFCKLSPQIRSWHVGGFGKFTGRFRRNFVSMFPSRYWQSLCVRESSLYFPPLVVKAPRETEFIISERKASSKFYPCCESLLPEWNGKQKNYILFSLKRVTRMEEKAIRIFLALKCITQVERKAIYIECHWNFAYSKPLSNMPNSWCVSTLMLSINLTNFANRLGEISPNVPHVQILVFFVNFLGPF